MAGRNVSNPQQQQQIGVGLATVNRKVVKLERYGHRVIVRDEAHARTNHYIRCSEEFFPDENLTCYWTCPKLNYVAIFILCLCLIFSIFCNPVCLSLTFLPLVFLLPIYIQHEYVNQKTIPVILKQPLVPHQRLGNDFYELSVTQLSGVSMDLYNSGVGFLRVGGSHGSIKFMAFNVRGRNNIKKARIISRCLLFAIGAELLCATVYVPILCTLVFAP